MHHFHFSPPLLVCFAKTWLTAVPRLYSWMHLCVWLSLSGSMIYVSQVANSSSGKCEMLLRSVMCVCSIMLHWCLWGKCRSKVSRGKDLSCYCCALHPSQLLIPRCLLNLTQRSIMQQTADHTITWARSALSAALPCCLISAPLRQSSVEKKALFVYLLVFCVATSGKSWLHKERLFGLYSLWVVFLYWKPAPVCGWFCTSTWTVLCVTLCGYIVYVSNVCVLVY